MKWKFQVERHAVWSGTVEASSEREAKELAEKESEDPSTRCGEGIEIYILPLKEQE